MLLSIIFIYETYFFSQSCKSRFGGPLHSSLPGNHLATIFSHSQPQLAYIPINIIFILEAP